MRKKPAAAKKHVEGAKTASETPVRVLTPLEKARMVVESMYSLHLVLLLVMTVLASFSMVLVLKQQNEIDSLRFRLDFMYQRYGVERDRSATYLDTKNGDERGPEVSPSPMPRR